jgi:hypothetical protein
MRHPTSCLLLISMVVHGDYVVHCKAACGILATKGWQEENWTDKICSIIMCGNTGFLHFPGKFNIVTLPFGLTMEDG